MNQRDFVASPTDTRYVPFTQQGWCCVPTSLSMIMYRNNIPLIPAEELGYHLGLTIPSSEAHLFFRPRAGAEPPTAAGFGTQVFNEGFEFNTVFPKLGIPLAAEIIFSNEIKDEEDLISRLKTIEDEDSDALLCFDAGVFRSDDTHDGHVVVFDRIIDGKIRIVDASPKHPKWRLEEPEIILRAIREHPSKGGGGIWKFIKS